MIRVSRFYVRGRGHFPLDMLRYDECWPATGEDAAKMDEKDLRTIQLATITRPTKARWSSFPWTANEEDVWS